jgi:hypothetical protein
MKNQQRSPGFGGIKQLLQFCLGLVIAACLINASGIRQWAERLEIGNDYVPRQTLVELTTTWEGVVEYTGLNGVRRSVMTYRDSQGSMASKQDTQGSAKDEVTPTHVDANVKTKVEPKVESKVETKVEAKTESAPNGDMTTSIKSDKPTADNTLPIVIAGASPDTYIALAGDSMMAVGLAPHLTRMIEKNALGKVVRAYKSGTGLARPDVFNWLNEYPKMLAGKRPGIVICAIGANDGQGIQVDKRPLQFGTPAWEEEYARRVGAFSELLLKGGAKVYWVLLPHMRSPVYDQRMQNLNTFLQAKFKDVPNLVFISPDSMIVGAPAKTYVEYTQSGAKQERLRGEDGIHLSDAGGRNLAAGILKILQ